MAVVIASSTSELDKHIKEAADRLVIIMFTSASCAACRTVDPKVSQMSAEYGNRVLFIKVDVNQSNEIAHRYHIHLLPTFMFLKYGKTLDKVSGADTVQLSKKINEHLNK